MTSLRRRWHGPLNFLLVGLLSLLGYLGLVYLNDPDSLKMLRFSSVIGLSLLGCWRWSWVVFQLIRARFYLHGVFPRWRRAANQVDQADLPSVCCVVPTYKEQPWITERVFRALALEALTLSHPLTLLVTSGSHEENKAIAEILNEVDPGLKHIRLIQQVQTGEGKRKAMANGLRALAELDLPDDTIVALMDGDSEITPGTLRQSLPFFRLFPRVGALTTDELPIVKGSYLFSEWFHLRMAQRHHQMASIGLSQKVLCLTGRFSLFRAEAALDSTFADQLENDMIEDWLWGKFKFLSGDDKSTWFWLLSHGYDMLYVPDIVVYSIETISGSVATRAYNNMRRWYGNMLRNSNRAIALGPKVTGWFTWYSLVDQRINYWTNLLTPGLLLIALIQTQWTVFGLIFSWVCFSRPLVLMIIFWQRTSQLKLIHALLLPFSQWSGSLVKVWTQMNLAQQKWTNRGSQSISAAGEGWVKVSKLSTSRFLYSCQLFGLGILLAWMSGMVYPVDSIRQVIQSQITETEASLVSQAQTINTAEYGILGGDGKPDAAMLQALIDTQPADTPLTIQLPIGIIELEQPLIINRSHVTLQGQGIHRTILKPLFTQISDSNRSRASAQLDTPVNNSLGMIQIRPVQTTQGKSINTIELKDFTANTPIVNSIFIQQANQVTLKHLDLTASASPAIQVQNSMTPIMEYVAIPQETTDVALKSES